MGIRKIPPDTKYFTYHNENPKHKHAADCVIRAIAFSTGQTWEKTLKDLTEIALKYKVVPNEKAAYGRYLKELGFIECSQPKKSNGTKYRAYEFCHTVLNKYKHPAKIVAHVGSHHLTAIDNSMRGYYTVVDTFDCSDEVVGKYWYKRV